MPSPELRCLECHRQFADLTADQDVERCAECGKFVVAQPTLQLDPVAPAAPPPADIPLVSKADLADDLPLARPVRPPQPPVTLPAWAKRDDDPPPPKADPPKRPDTVRPVLPAPTRLQAERMSNTELPSQVEVKKPRVGLALFVAFLFLLAMFAAVGVLGYTIVRGLKMKRVITQAPHPAAFSRASDS